MAFKDLKGVIYQELKRKGYDLKKNYYELSHSQIHELVEIATKYGYKYNGARSYGYAFYNSIQRYYDKLYGNR